MKKKQSVKIRSFGNGQKRDCYIVIPGNNGENSESEWLKLVDILIADLDKKLMELESDYVFG